MDAKLALVKDWLDKALRDLASARRLADGPEPYLDTAIYHCQQAAEKALKGWLAYHDQRFEKTHDVRSLTTLAAAIEPRFIDWFDVAERLTPYATAYRYPGEGTVPEMDEFQEALEITENLVAFVRSILPPNLSSIDAEN